MGLISYTIPTAGSTQNFFADPEVATALQTLLAWANGNIDATNLSPTLAQMISVNQSSQAVKGASNIGPSETVSSATYTTMPTPDRVTNIVVPTNGLLAVWFQAAWQESVAGAARAAIFIGSNQLKITETEAAAPVTQAAATGSMGPVGFDAPLASSPGGLFSYTPGTPGYPGDVTTGQVVGLANSIGAWNEFGSGGAVAVTANAVPLAGPCWIEVVAGTYTVSVQYKASSGTVKATGRRLRVQAISFS